MNIKNIKKIVLKIFNLYVEYNTKIGLSQLNIYKKKPVREHVFSSGFIGEQSSTLFKHNFFVSPYVTKIDSSCNLTFLNRYDSD